MCIFYYLAFFTSKFLYNCVYVLEVRLRSLEYINLNNVNVIIAWNQNIILSYIFNLKISMLIKQENKLRSLSVSYTLFLMCLYLNNDINAFLYNISFDIDQIIKKNMIFYPKKMI